MFVRGGDSGQRQAGRDGHPESLETIMGADEKGTGRRVVAARGGQDRLPVGVQNGAGVVADLVPGRAGPGEVSRRFVHPAQAKQCKAQVRRGPLRGVVHAGRTGDVDRFLQHGDGVRRYSEPGEGPAEVVQHRRQPPPIVQCTEPCGGVLGRATDFLEISVVGEHFHPDERRNRPAPVIAQCSEFAVRMQQGRIGVGVGAAADPFHGQQQLGERGSAAVPDQPKDVKAFLRGCGALRAGVHDARAGTFDQ